MELIKGIINLPKVENEIARIRYLIKMMEKHQTELKSLGIDIQIAIEGANEAFLKNPFINS